MIDDIFVDLDGVCACFDTGMTEAGLEVDMFKVKPGSYLWLPLIPNAVESVKQLIEQFPDHVWFLTKPPKHSPYAYVEKALWVQRYFGDYGLHHLIVSQDKSLVGTADSILVDDRPHKGNVENFRGTVLHFGSSACPTWSEVLDAIVQLDDDRFNWEHYGQYEDLT